MSDIFVFGSNRAGRHGKGAALYAAKHYGAQYGVGEGRTGSAYAIPTKGHQLEVLPLSEVEQAVARFCEYARRNPAERFLLTPVGCGLAGNSKADIAKTLRRYQLPENVVLTSSWITN